MKLTFLPACLLACILTIPSFAQNTARSVQNPSKKFAFYHNSDQTLSHLNFFEQMGAQMQIAASDMVLEEQHGDAQGFTHYKYQQYHQGLPIFGCHYFLHEKDGVLRSANGQFQPGANTSAQPTLNAAGAESIARRAMHSKKVNEEKTNSSLCFINLSANQSPRSLRLAFKVDLHSIDPYNKRRYFIDANTGKILKELPLILEEGVPSKAKTFYYGTQDIISDSVGPQDFVLRDLTRGEGIFVYNVNTGDLFTNNSSFWDLGNVNMEEVGLDAHYCSEKYYDMMMADYHWEGVDGQGGALIANVHDGAYVNAYWDGESTTYGDGDCNYGPLTTLEVMGHEFTHGMVDYTSKLVYDSESGAMNESLADMFGKLLERKVDPAHFSWDLGHSFILNPDSEPFRVMDDPNAVQMPAYYKGLYWNDNNDVHTNSSIGNLWFSMILDGRQGTNEAGYNFDVKAIGPDKGGQIIFNTNKNYLSENSNYNNFCAYSIEVAGDLYGQGSPEQLAVIEAWKAVGLPSGAQGDSYDLALNIDDQYYTVNICGLNEFNPITFSITNNGTTDYDPATQGKVILSSFNLSDRVIQLNAPIAAGETVDFVVADWFKADNYGYLSVTYNLDVIDDSPDNNYAYGSFNAVQYESDDLYLSAYLIDPQCFEQTQVGYFYITNNSCQPVPAGTDLQIVAKNAFGSTLWTGPVETLFSEIMGGYSASYFYEVPVFTETVVFNLIYLDDPDQVNNEFYYEPLNNNLPITGNYLNTFEINNGDDGYLSLYYPGSEATLLYQNSHFFASTGSFSDPEGFQHCADPFSVFNNPYSTGLNASINACLDYSAASAPTLEFDAALFLSDYSSSTNYIYSSMLHAKWDGTESGGQTIYNQPEGQVKHTKINLPPYFKGQLTLYLYTELGQWITDVAYLNDDDFVLVDNLKLRNATSADHEAPDSKSVLIAPNPAQETVRIQTEIPMTSIRIFNAAGQLLNTLNLEGIRQDLDLKGLGNGLYWVNVRLQDGTESVQKLVKMD